MLMVTLVIIEIILFLLNYKISRNDICNPSTISILSILMGTFFSILGKNEWDLKFIFSTFLVCIIGCIAITLSNLIRCRVKIKHSYYRKTKVSYNYKYIKIATVVSIICCLVYGIESYRVGINAGGTGLNAFAYMKNLYLDNMSGNRMNVIIRQLFKVIMAIAYVDSFILVDNLIDKREKNINIFLIFAIISGIVVTIFSGSRTEILRLMSALILDYSVIKGSIIKSKNKKKISKEVIKKLAFVVGGISIIAFLTRNIVKTKDVLTSAIGSVLQYAIYYVGSPLAVLNNKIKSSGIGNNFLLANQWSKNDASAFTYLGKLNYGGNVASFFCTVLSEGIFYMALRIFVTMLIFNIIYRTFIINIEENFRRNKYVIIFSFAYFIFLTAFYSYNVSLLFDSSSIAIIILILLYYKAIVCLR